MEKALYLSFFERIEKIKEKTQSPCEEKYWKSCIGQTRFNLSEYIWMNLPPIGRSFSER